MDGTWSRSDDEILGTLQDVVAIDSVNPSLPGRGKGEGGMVEYLGAFFDALEIPYELSEVLPGRNNIIATLEGEDPSRAILFECHMDTASVEVMTIPPFEPHIRDGMLYGRGSCDTKAGGVAMMHAMKHLKDAGVRPPQTVLYAGAMDEEYLMRGSRHMAQYVEVAAAVIAEPTDLEVIRAHKGIVRFDIVVKGKAAHSSKPDLGVNAISKIARLIVRIEEEMRAAHAGKSDPLLGAPTMNIGTIQGGAQVNFVPDSCQVAVDNRILPSETIEEVIGAFEEILARARAEDDELDVAMAAPSFACAAMGTEEDASIVKIAAAACRGVLGDAVIAGVPYGTDAGPFSDRGVPAVVLGPGSIDQAHGAVEWVECEQVLRASEIYQRIMESECQKPGS